jgi:hypothetical protein
MPSERPIACSLSPAQSAQRLAEISAIGETSLLGAEIDGGRAVLRFRAGAREQLAAIVAAESECCAFLTMKLDHGPPGVRLAIDAPAGAEPVLQDLVAAFSRHRQGTC